MEQTLRSIVAKIAETQPDFSKGAHLRDELKVDSVRVMELMFEIEQTFSVKFPEERYAEVNTFDDLVKVVESLKL
jgi:acyl carrier protein